jgi:hypothetical protein
MAHTICVECSRKDKCPKFQDRINEIPEWITKYKKIIVYNQTTDDAPEPMETYKILECKYFKQKEKHKLSKAFDRTQMKQKGKISYGKIAIFETETEKIHAEKKIVTRAIDRFKNMLDKIDKVDKEREFEEQLLEDHKKIKNLKMPKKWHKLEEEFLQKYYKLIDIKGLAKLLSRNPDTVRSKAFALNIYIPNRKHYTKEDETLIKKYYQGETKYKDLKELADGMGRTYESILAKTKNMSIRKSMKGMGA